LQELHLKSNNNIISELAVIVLSIVLLTGMSLVPVKQLDDETPSLRDSNDTIVYDLLPIEEDKERKKGAFSILPFQHHPHQMEHYLVWLHIHSD
jgi:hypothetical protein